MFSEALNLKGGGNFGTICSLMNIEASNVVKAQRGEERGLKERGKLYAVARREGKREREFQKSFCAEKNI